MLKLVHQSLSFFNVVIELGAFKVYFLSYYLLKQSTSIRYLWYIFLLNFRWNTKFGDSWLTSTSSWLVAWLTCHRRRWCASGPTWSSPAKPRAFPTRYFVQNILMWMKWNENWSSVKDLLLEMKQWRELRQLKGTLSIQYATVGIQIPDVSGIPKVESSPIVKLFEFGISIRNPDKTSSFGMDLSKSEQKHPVFECQSKTGPFNIRPSKCLVFKCFRHSNVRYLDPIG